MAATLAALAATAAVMLGLTARVIAYLRGRQILDRPNDRSSHVVPTPRGGGLAVTPAVLSGWVVAAIVGAAPAWPVLALAGAALLLMGVSWLDDRHSLPPGRRLALHAVAVLAGLAALPGDGLVFQGWLPPWADHALTALAWLWFVNLYNFMDGIDGITGVETAVLGLGIAAVAWGSPPLAEVQPLALAAALAGLLFLRWNWPPAQTFLGDVGSIPLGYLLGALLIVLARNGQLAAALILPAYYVADATLTLGKRALRREKIWQPHRSHFYQRAVQGGRSHAQVTTAVLAAGLGLIAAALLARHGLPLAGLSLGGAITAGLLTVMQRWARAEKRP